MVNNDKNRADQILDSLNGIHKAHAPEFFYTRLIGRMQNDLDRETKPFFLLRPAFITAVLAIVLVINVVSLTNLSGVNSNKASIQTTEPATIESFAKAYNLEAESVYE